MTNLFRHQRTFGTYIFPEFSKKIKTIGLAFLFAPEYMQARYILSKSCLSVRHVTLSVMENDRTAEKSQVIDDNERATTFITELQAVTTNLSTGSRYFYRVMRILIDTTLQ